MTSYETEQNIKALWAKLGIVQNTMCCCVNTCLRTNPPGDIFWNLIGNSGTNTSTNFIGTTDNTGLVFKTNNITFGSITPTQYLTFTAPQPGGNTSYIYNGSISLFAHTLPGVGFDYYIPSSGIHSIAFAGDYSSLGGHVGEITVGLLNESTGEEAVFAAHYNGGGTYELGMEVITNTGTSKVLVQNNLINIETSVLNIQTGTPGLGKVLTSDATGNATWQSPVLYTQTATKQIINTTTETSLISSGVGTAQIPANTTNTGTSYQIKIRGFHSNNSFDNLTVRVKIGGSIITSNIVTSGPGAVNTGVGIDVILTFYSTGAGGTYWLQGTYIEEGSTSASLPTTTVKSLDTTVNQAIDVTLQWGTATNSDQWTVTNFIITRIG